MADRLEFKYMRVAKSHEAGTVAIDVRDPTDADEIKELLSNREFVEFLPLEKTLDEERWSFVPLEPDDDEELPASA